MLPVFASGESAVFSCQPAANFTTANGNGAMIAIATNAPATSPCSGSTVGSTVVAGMNLDAGGIPLFCSDPFPSNMIALVGPSAVGGPQNVSQVAVWSAKDGAYMPWPPA